MLKQLQLADLFLGSTDAKNELLDNDKNKEQRFMDSFLLPENIRVNDFLIGNKYIIKGMKGTGKTALLRYLNIHAKLDMSAITSFILFKSDIDMKDKEAFARVAHTSITEKNNELANEADYEYVWRWYLHRHIVRYMQQTNINLFEDDIQLEKYKACVLAARDEGEQSGILKLIPKLKRGNIELEAGTELLKGKLGLDFEWEDNDKTIIKFENLVKQADVLYSKLNPTQNRMYIFIDELELTLGRKKEYERDVLLVRDLIVTINRFNSLATTKSYKLKIITGIRTEVVNSIKSTGKEINKIVADFGIPISWHQKGGDLKQHPILKLIEKRIRASEKFNGIEESNNIWDKYFERVMNGENIQEYILEQTWYRPRDVVRMLGIAQNKYPNQIMFTQEVFDTTKKDYSTESWTELVEELRTKYSESDIDGIKRILYGSENPFSFKYFNQSIDHKSEIYDNVEKLKCGYKSADILTDLYRVGVIGNSGEKIRFSFRGDDEILLENNITVHWALRPYLSTVPKKKNNKVIR